MQKLLIPFLIASLLLVALVGRKAYGASNFPAGNIEFAALAPAAASTPVAPGTMARVNRNANVRIGPDTTFLVHHGVRTGDILEVIGVNDNGTWYQLKNDSSQDELWIFADLVTILATPTPTTAPTATATFTPTSTAIFPPTATATPEPGFGDGVYIVQPKDGNRDDTKVVPGNYRSVGIGLCYWARLNGLSGEATNIIADGDHTQEIVAIGEGDIGFATQGCGHWIPAAEAVPWSPPVGAPPALPLASFGDGTYLVGKQIASGSYHAEGGALCYWARLSDFSHLPDSIIADAYFTPMVTIEAGDKGFTSFGCGKWSQ